MKYFKSLCKHLVLFAVGGAVYYCIELLWRQYSHISMVLIGGLCFVLIGLINEFLSWETPLSVQMLIAACIITAVEFVAGLVLNVWLGWNVWDYSHLPLNLMGQICLLYSVLWFALSYVGIRLDDYLRYWWFGEDKPRYRIFKE